MGRSYWFECGRCGYRAKVSGRADRGKDFFIQTILCQDCKQLYDAVTRVRFQKPLYTHGHGKSAGTPPSAMPGRARPVKVAPAFESMLARLPATDLRRFKWVHFPLQCPVSTRHRVEAWNEPSTCPRCGVYLERTALPYRIWD